MIWLIVVNMYWHSLLKDDKSIVWVYDNKKVSCIKKENKQSIYVGSKVSYMII